MTTKQILFSAFILGSISSITLTMDKNRQLRQQQPQSPQKKKKAKQTQQQKQLRSEEQLKKIVLQIETAKLQPIQMKKLSELKRQQQPKQLQQNQQAMQLQLEKSLNRIDQQTKNIDLEMNYVPDHKALYKQLFPTPQEAQDQPILKQELLPQELSREAQQQVILKQIQQQYLPQEKKKINQTQLQQLEKIEEKYESLIRRYQ